MNQRYDKGNDWCGVVWCGIVREKLIYETNT